MASGMSPTSSRKSVPPLRTLELPSALPCGSGKCSGFMTKKLALDELARDGRAVEFLEWFGGPFRLPVNCTSD